MIRLVVTSIAFALLSSCTQIAPRYTPAIENVQILRDSGAGKARIGRFGAYSDSANDDSISLRFHPLVSPAGGKFTAYLEDALTTELGATQRLDDEADVEISGALLRNNIDVWGLCKGTAMMQAQVVVRRGADVRYDKVKCAHITFKSSFSGGIAVRRGKRAYLDLVQEFLSVLYADEDFLYALE